MANFPLGIRCMGCGGGLLMTLLGACTQSRDPENEELGDQVAHGDAGLSADDAQTGDDASSTTGRHPGVVCCAPSSTPNCCMNYGGAKLGETCDLRLCDGMPVPSDPAWRLVDDEHGCPRWSSEGSTGRCCGAPSPPDGGAREYSCFGDHGEPPRRLDAGR